MVKAEAPRTLAQRCAAGPVCSRTCWSLSSPRNGLDNESCRPARAVLNDWTGMCKEVAVPFLGPSWAPGTAALANSSAFVSASVVFLAWARAASRASRLARHALHSPLGPRIPPQEQWRILGARLGRMTAEAGIRVAVVGAWAVGPAAGAVFRRCSGLRATSKSNYPVNPVRRAWRTCESIMATVRNGWRRPIRHVN
jgi:hypothetical protein